MKELKVKVMASPDILSETETDIILISAQHDCQTEIIRVSALWKRLIS